MSSRILYDLALADPDVRPSPWCWIAKFALLHKGLPFETRVVPFADKSKYPDPDYGKVPVLVDNSEMVKDSLAITAWLDRKYPSSPLVATKGERAAAEFMAAWLVGAFLPALAPALISRIHAHIPEADKEYFKSTREKRFGRSLEELAALPVAEKAEAALAVVAAPLCAHRYFGGAAPNLCDYILMAPFMWQRSVTGIELYATPEPVALWRERMLDCYDGYARSAKSANAA